MTFLFHVLCQFPLEDNETAETVCGVLYMPWIWSIYYVKKEHLYASSPSVLSLLL